MSPQREHLPLTREVTPSALGCDNCLQSGNSWVHLHMCMTCGHVGCCDSSPNRHATAHWHNSEHPLVRSFQPGEDWWWCFPDNRIVTAPGAGPAPSYH